MIAKKSSAIRILFWQKPHVPFGGGEIVLEEIFATAIIIPLIAPGGATETFSSKPPQTNEDGGERVCLKMKGKMCKEIWNKNMSVFSAVLAVFYQQCTILGIICSNKCSMVKHVCG